jgi:hypothetical protein
VFRHKTITLAAGIEHDEHRDAARQALRGFPSVMLVAGARNRLYRPSFTWSPPETTYRGLTVIAWALVTLRPVLSVTVRVTR